MKRQAKIELFLSDARGIYIPRDFAQCVVRDRIKGVDMADLDYLARGPHDIEATDDEPAHDAEAYWDVWQSVCDDAVLTGDDGTEYTIHQDGDCWLVERGAEFDESSEFDLGFYVDDGEPEMNWFSTSSGRIEFQLSLSDAESGSQPGKDASEDIEALRRLPYIAKQLAEIDADLLRDELREYGAWDDAELADHEKSLDRILWIACCDIKEAAR